MEYEDVRSLVWVFNVTRIMAACPRWVTVARGPSSVLTHFKRVLLCVVLKLRNHVFCCCFVTLVDLGSSGNPYWELA